MITTDTTIYYTRQHGLYDNVYSKSYFLLFSLYFSLEAFKRALNLSLNSRCVYLLYVNIPWAQAIVQATWVKLLFFLLFVLALLLSILTPLFLPFPLVSMSYFILATPMRNCQGKHCCMGSSFPIAILNGTFFSDSATTSAQCVFRAKRQKYLSTSKPELPN